MRGQALLEELSSNQPISPRCGVNLLNSFMQRDGWPTGVTVHYLDRSTQQRRIDQLGTPSGQAYDPVFPLQIQHAPNGELTVGLRRTPVDLQLRIAQSPLNHVDALVSALRLAGTQPAEKALSLLMKGTYLLTKDLCREVDPQGLPTGLYEHILKLMMGTQVEVLKQEHKRVVDDLMLMPSQ